TDPPVHVVIPASLGAISLVPAVARLGHRTPHLASAIPRHDAAVRTSDRELVGAGDVRADVRASPGGLGHALGCTLPDRAVRLPAPAFHPAPQPHAVRGAAADAHRPRVPVLHHLPGALPRAPVPHFDLAGRN